MQPLKGIKVVDLSKLLAGPLCAQYLGELGAEIIKIEPVGQGDDTRGWLPQTNGQSAIFIGCARKTSPFMAGMQARKAQPSFLWSLI